MPESFCGGVDASAALPPVSGAPPAAGQMPRAASPSALRRGLGAFGVLSVLGIMGIFFFTSRPADLGSIWARVHVPYLLACLLGVPLLEWLVAGLRMWLFARPISPQITYPSCALNCAVGAFMSAATPSQTGGGVAQAYVLVKEGATAAKAVTILLLTFLSTLVFYVIVCFATWGLGGRITLPGWDSSAPFAIAVLLFGSLAALGLFTAWRPEYAERWLLRGAAWLKKRELPTGHIDRLMGGVSDASRALAAAGRQHRLRFLASVPLTSVLFGGKFLSAYLAARALGVEAPFTDLILAQIFLHILLYFFPTPGGAGGAEAGAALVMSRFIPAELLPAYTVLWRAATMYLSVLVGGIILVGHLRRELS